MDLHYTVHIKLFCKVNLYTCLIVCCSRCHGNHACFFVYILNQGHNKGLVPIPTNNKGQGHIFIGQGHIYLLAPEVIIKVLVPILATRGNVSPQVKVKVNNSNFCHQGQVLVPNLTARSECVATVATCPGIPYSLTKFEGVPRDLDDVTRDFAKVKVKGQGHK